MTWLLVYEIIYIVVLVLVCLRIIYDTRSNTKTLAYLLLVIFLPLIGIFFYFSFGINYRKRKMYTKKLVLNDIMAKELREYILQSSQQIFEKNTAAVQPFRELARMLIKDSMSALTGNNTVKLLVNGEEKFPEVLEA